MDQYLIDRAEKHKLFAKTLELSRKIYDKNCVGGLLHIVLDDGNLKNNHIESCIEDIENSNSEDKELYLKCAINLLKMTPTQRIKLYKSSYR